VDIMGTQWSCACICDTESYEGCVLFGKLDLGSPACLSHAPGLSIVAIH